MVEWHTVFNFILSSWALECSGYQLSVMSCILLGGSPTGLLIILISLCLLSQGIYYTMLSGIWCVGGRESELLAELPSTQTRGSGCCLFCEPQAWGWDCPPGVPGTDLAAGVQAGALWASALSTSCVSFLGWPQRVNRKLDGCRQQRFTGAVLQVLKVGSRLSTGPRSSQPACWWPSHPACWAASPVSALPLGRLPVPPPLLKRTPGLLD